MIDLPDDLRTAYDSLPASERRLADHFAGSHDRDALAEYLRHRAAVRARKAAEAEAMAEAIAAVDPLPGLTRAQTLFVAALDPDRKARLDAMPDDDREDLLAPLADVLDPIILDLARDRLSRDGPILADVRPRGGIRRIRDRSVNRSWR